MLVAEAFAICVLVALVVALFRVERRALAISPVGPVVPGAHLRLFDWQGHSSGDLLSAVCQENALRDRGGPVPVENAAQLGDAEPRNRRAASPGSSTTLSTGLIAGGLAGGTGLADWWHVDADVLGAFEQWTHQDIHNGLDLVRLIHSEHYDKLATHGFDIKLRGHVGEQHVYDQLDNWAGGSLHIPDASNNPAADFTLGGHEFNIKVGASSDAIREHLSNHPGIPVVVNADMADLPADAFHVDLSHAVSPDVLADHSVIVADGLLLSGLHESMADALGPALDSFDAGDVVDSLSDLGVPVLGSAIRVVRSGLREQKLAKHHGDAGRAMKNIGTDVAYVGGGVTAGGAAGVGLGLLIDVLSGGMTAGFGMTVIGPAIGSMFGGLLGSKKASEHRIRPLIDAREKASDATLAYDAAVTSALSKAQSRWSGELVPASQERLTQIACDLSVRNGQFMKAARDGLAGAHVDLEAAARVELAALVVAQANGPRPGGVIVGRRVARWSRAATAALGATEGASGTADLLDVLLAHADGREPCERLATRLAERRSVVLAAAAEVRSRLTNLTLAARADEVARLEGSRQRLVQQTRRATSAPLDGVWQATDQVRKELVATRAKTTEWVAEKLPAVPRLTKPSSS